MPPDPLTTLSDTIRAGLPGPEGGIKPLLEALFGDRYQQRHFEKTLMRACLS